MQQNQLKGLSKPHFNNPCTKQVNLALDFQRLKTKTMTAQI